MPDLADALIAWLCSVGIAFGLVYTAHEMREPEVIVKRVETCSPRSIDYYSGQELVGIGYARMRMAKVRKK